MNKREDIERRIFLKRHLVDITEDEIQALEKQLEDLSDEEGHKKTRADNFPVVSLQARKAQILTGSCHERLTVCWL